MLDCIDVADGCKGYSSYSALLFSAKNGII
jgi:hypothetical protein